MNTPVTPTFKRIDIDHAVKVLKTPGLIPIAGSFGSGTFAEGGECCLLAALVGEVRPDQSFEGVDLHEAAEVLDIYIDYTTGLMSGWDSPYPPDDPRLHEPSKPAAEPYRAGLRDGSVARHKAAEAGIAVKEDDDDDDEDWDDDEYDDEDHEDDDDD